MGHGRCSLEVWQLSSAHIYDICGEEAARTPRLSVHQEPTALGSGLFSRWAVRGIASSMCLASMWLTFVAAWCGLVRGMKATAPDLSTTLGEDHQSQLPYFLGGPPSDLRDRASGPGSSLAPHRAHGPGLHSASTGTPASFTIRLRGRGCGGGWEHTHANQNASAEDSLPLAMDDKHFVYVWIASTDHVLHAAVVNNGDGTLTATYESPYPGDYLVHIQDVCTDMSVVGRGKKRPWERAKAIVDSPFKLTISGEIAVDVDDLPLCDAEHPQEDEEDTFWRTGSWISSKFASAKHGVLRDGWVFQPKTCVHDTFSYDDLMLLATGLKEPTWLLILGTSVQRGVFLTLVDMVLAQGQKSDFATSAIQKCWGFAEIRVGNLRLTYQDLRLHEVGLAQDDSAVCHDDKLAINNVAVFVAAARRFLRRSVFAAGKQWPSVIVAPPFMEDSDEAANLPITVIMDALPSAWNGTLLMMEHMAGLGFTYNYDNPTAATLAEVNPTWHLSKFIGVDNGLGRIKKYQQQDDRTTFMSTFPMYQSRLFENEFSSPGRPCYGCSYHYHYVTKPTAPESFNGSRMIHSAVTEMLANIVISKAVGSKAALYEKATPSTNKHRGGGNETFEVCTDCPANLIPHHVKPVPVPVCDATSVLAGDAAVGEAWGGRGCPQWCSKEPVDGVLNLKDVRVCSRARK